MVTMIVSATITLLMVCIFLIIALQVATGGTSDVASGITTVLIAASTFGSNLGNDPSSKEQEFQKLKKKIMNHVSSVLFFAFVCTLPGEQPWFQYY